MAQSDLFKNCYFSSTMSLSKQIDKLRHLGFFVLSFKKGLTLPSLKTPRNLFKDNGSLQRSITMNYNTNWNNARKFLYKSLLNSAWL